MLYFPAREIRRADGRRRTGTSGPNLRAHAEHVLATEDLPDYPDEMRETFQRADGRARHRRARSSSPPRSEARRGLRGHPLRGRRPAGRRSRSTAPSASTRSAGQTMLELCEAFERGGRRRGRGRDRVHRRRRPGVLRRRRRARAHPHDGREAARPRHRPAPGRARCATTASRSSAGCAAGASAAATSSTWSRDLTDLGHLGPLRPGRPEDRQRPAVVGLPADPGGGGREEGARGPVPHPPVHGRGGAGDGAGQRGRARRGARRRGRPLVRARSCAARPQGLRLAKIALNAATDALYSSTQPRDGADGAEPRPRAGAEGGHRQLPGEAAGRLAPLPRRARAPSRRRAPDGPSGATGTPREDPTTWVLAEILRRRAEETPDRDYLQVRRRPLGELRRGERPGQPDRQRPDRRAGCSRASRCRVMLPNCEEFLPVWYGILKAGAVMSSDQHRLQGRLPVLDDQPGRGARSWSSPTCYLDRLDLIKGELPLLEHVIVLQHRRSRRAPTRRCPGSRWTALMDGPRRRARRRRVLLDRRRPDHVHLGHHRAAPRASSSRTRPTTSRPAACSRWSRRRAGKSVETLADDTFFSCLPLFHSNAQVLSRLPGAGGRRRGWPTSSASPPAASGSR